MNLDQDRIKKDRFANVFRRFGWIHSEAKSGNYDIWTSPNNSSLWTVVPKDELSEDYYYYQEKNIKILLHVLNLPENDFNTNDIHSQLIGFNYKLINKIVNRDTYSSDIVPFELADTLSNKNIDAFRFYYKVKMRGKTIPIEDFQLHRTQKGSFIIPISIAAQPDQDKLFDVASTTNIVIRDYLKTIDNLIKIPVRDEKSFADKVIEENIDSKIVKVFLGNSDSIAKTKQRYQDKIKEISISSNGSPILDYGLSKEEKEFPEVDISGIGVLSDNFVEVLEAREVEADSSTIEESGVKINVEVDSLDQNGSVKFSVFVINGHEVTKPFKARSTKLTKNTLNSLTDAFKSREIIEVTGDITKSKGKVGEIVADKFDVKQENLTLFNTK